tara:strand:+ start:2546 stop:3244 length:699 start_codon:yes stop_codon:yes gene_type:complete
MWKAFVVLMTFVAVPARAQTCGICSFSFGCTDRFSCNFDADADAPDPDNALCNYGPDINRDRVCDEFQTFADIVCIEGQTDLVTPRGSVKAGRVQPGDILRTPSGETRVRRVRAYNQTHHPLRIEEHACGNHGPVTVTEDHAVWCKDRWFHASEIGSHATSPGDYQYVAIETENYCDDRLLTVAGLSVEGWDGREKSKWRPHQYDDQGRRVRCANRGTWWELILWSLDRAFV